ncbi:MAG: hypothetical protein AAF330_05245 [Pseudomonadota bacterium]
MRQPWAWAILYGGKVIENRSLASIRAGGTDCRRIAIHAAAGMTEEEYRWGVWRLQQHGVRAPRPEELPRRAIIGTVDVVDIISASESAWFGGDHGLLLEHPIPCAPVPASGALEYFAWRAGGIVTAALPWMLRYDRPAGDAATGALFPDLEQSFRVEPRRPGRKR